MDAKTIVAIVLVAFIIGAMIWLATTSRPFPIYMEVYDEKSQNH